MKSPRRHTESAWCALWARIDDRALAKQLRVDVGVVRTWKSRGALPEASWTDIARFTRIPYSEVAGQLRKP